MIGSLKRFPFLGLKHFLRFLPDLYFGMPIHSTLEAAAVPDRHGPHLRQLATWVGWRACDNRRESAN
jgi:hypothetical protein